MKQIAAMELDSAERLHELFTCNFHNGERSVTRATPPPVAEQPITLSDADIASEPNVSRRSLLGTLGITAGLAAAVALGTADSAPAADTDTKKKKKAPPKKPAPKEETDSD